MASLTDILTACVAPSEKAISHEPLSPAVHLRVYGYLSPATSSSALPNPQGMVDTFERLTVRSVQVSTGTTSCRNGFFDCYVDSVCCPI